MLLNFEERQSDSPFVERIWRTRSERAGTFISLAMSHTQMCVWKAEGKTYLTVRGPETKATRVPVPADREYIGIVLKLGAFMPHLPVSSLVDTDLTLPEAADRSVWLHGSAWELPDYENADVFVNRLVHEGLLVREPAVKHALLSQPQEISLRTVQRRFYRATGVTRNKIYQIERARYATILLQQGTSILDTVFQAGYADQPHLTRSLHRWTGQTPAQIADQHEPEQLSFLFKTTLVE